MGGAGRGASLDDVPGALAAPATSRAAQPGPPGGRDAEAVRAVGLPVLQLRVGDSWDPGGSGTRLRVRAERAMRTGSPRPGGGRAGASTAGPAKV